MKDIYLSVHFSFTGLILLVALTLSCCDRNRNHPGWDYFPDMFYSTAYETYTPNPNFKDGMTMRAPVTGTVPRDFTPFHYTIEGESRILAGIELVNPVTPDALALDRGKQIFSIFCSGCHGATGLGDGFLFTSGLYPLKPRPLAGSAAAELKDGEIFHSITLGFGSMGAHEAQILPDDRWKVVLFIRKLKEEAAVLPQAED